jgi:hypothetical protein
MTHTELEAIRRRVAKVHDDFGMGGRIKPSTTGKCCCGWWMR